jgi:hypothetical protein
VVQDADMEYDPFDVPALVEPIRRGVADVVYGSRLSGGRPQRAYMFWHLVGNRFLSLLTGLLFNTTITDMETGYKAFRAEALTELCLTEDRFGIEPEITAEVCRRRMRVYEIPIAYYGRTYEEGKNISWRDGFRAVFVLMRARVRPLREPEARLPLISCEPRARVEMPADAAGKQPRRSRPAPRLSSTARGPDPAHANERIARAARHV